MMHSSINSRRTEPNLYLVGMMGTGKSTIGKRLANRLTMNFIDSDKSIEDSSGFSVSEIFTRFGEKHFRMLEHKFILEGHDAHNQVVACGGGLCIPPGMMETLKTKGRVICLWASAETLVERTTADQSRPLLQVSRPYDQLRLLINKRESRYREADFIIDTDNLTADEVVDKILANLQ